MNRVVNAVYLDFSKRGNHFVQFIKRILNCFPFIELRNERLDDVRHQLSPFLRLSGGKVRTKAPDRLGRKTEKNEPTEHLELYLNKCQLDHNG
jgi:hypothetical protein